jgi:hypothetical protein
MAVALVRVTAILGLFAGCLVLALVLAARAGGPATPVVHATLPTPTPTPVWSYIFSVTNDTGEATNHLSVHFRHGSIRVLNYPPGCNQASVSPDSDPYPGDVLVPSDIYLNHTLWTNPPCFDPGEAITIQNQHWESPSFTNWEPFTVLHCADRDLDTLCDVDEIANGTNPADQDTDADGYKDPEWTVHNKPEFMFNSDNCPLAHNDDQLNTDGDLMDLSPPKAFDDITHPSSDVAGDACDDDDDNDGLSDDEEVNGSACAGMTSDPLLLDTDGDMYTDGAECTLESDPGDINGVPASLALCGGPIDSDGDRLSDRMERCFYGTDPNAVDSDGDGCSDGREAGSVNGDRTVNSIDLGQAAQSFGNYSLPADAVQRSFDVAKDGSGRINSMDMALIAQSFGPC